MEKITVLGKEYEVSFGKMFLARLSSDLNISLADISAHLEKNPILSSLELIKISLEEGARIAKKKDPGFTIEQLADAWDADEQMVENFITKLNDSFEKKYAAAT